jgi:hypothetical protein
VPHLTLDRRDPSISPESVSAALAGLIPVHAKAERIDLQWWDDHDRRLLASWALG